MKINRDKKEERQNDSRFGAWRRRLRVARDAVAAVFPPVAQPKRTPSSRSFSPARSERLDEVRSLIRLGFFSEAEALILRVGDDCLRDADCLNLLGVIAEEGRSWKAAQLWYGKALRLDPTHVAAQQNFRRIYELRTFGQSEQRMSLGDERPMLNELLNSRSRRDVDDDTIPEPGEQTTVTEPIKVPHDRARAGDSCH